MFHFNHQQKRPTKFCPYLFFSFTVSLLSFKQHFPGNFELPQSQRKFL